VIELRELLVEGWSGLMVHRVRSMLSGLGILFGVAAVIGILSIGEGARREQELLIGQLGILNFQIRNRDLPKTPETEELRRKSNGLSRRDQSALAGILPDVAQVGASRELELPELLPRPRDPSKVRVLGADPAWLAGSNLELVSGRPLSALDEQTQASVAVIGAGAARELFPAKSALGERVRVGSTWLTVVGTFDEVGQSGSMEGVDIDNRSGAVVAPLSTVLGRMINEDGEPELTEIQVTVREVGQVTGHVTLARRVLDRLHREQDDVEIVVPLRLLEQSRAQQRLFNWVMGLIAGISLLVGGIGIMNIMLATVLERTREIGVRLAVGARPRDIAGLFLVEASLISLMGGAIGVVAGLALSWMVATATGWSTAVSPWAVLLAFVLSVAEGLLFGWLPAQRAARLPPVIAVRQG
jgi:putative ABC transport system permease protein